MKFSELELNEDLLSSIESLGFEDTTPIQEQAIPLGLQGKDLIACAQTGTGKTAAYLIPTIERIMKGGECEFSRALIIAPTRELADQIDQQVEAISFFTGVSSVAVYGGKNSREWDKQSYAIKNGVDILICTPGRLNTHASLGYLNFDHIEVLILDEADKMLDMGFYPDILRIVSWLPEVRQTLMFSATMPKNIRKMAREILNEPEEINLNISKPAAGINQMAFSVYDEQKIPLLEHLIKTREVESMIIFASKKTNVDKIAKKLDSLGYGVRAIHSDKEQEERMQSLREFKNGEFKILVGTDVLARGIDIDSLSHVLNFDVPLDAEDYVHRVGRTARASSTGEAMTFINPTDQRRFQRIEELIEMVVAKPEMPSELGETPVYAPGKRQSGGGGGRGGDSRGGRNDRGRGGDRNRGGGDRRGGGGGNRRGSGRDDGRRSNNNRNRPDNRRKGGGENRNQSTGGNGQNQDQRPKSENTEEANKSNNRNRNRNRRRKPRKPGEQNNGGDSQPKKEE